MVWCCLTKAKFEGGERVLHVQYRFYPKTFIDSWVNLQEVKSITLKKSLQVYQLWYTFDETKPRQVAFLFYRKCFYL